jgi:PGF-CTERM protein
MGEISEVRATFSGPTSGFVSISSTSGLPDGAPAPSGTLIAAVDISPPEDVASSPGTVALTVSRAAVADADVEPSELRIVRYDEAVGELDGLDTEVGSETDETVVVTAETPGFSVFGVVATEQQATTTATPAPTATETPEPTATETPEPTATETPEPTATEGDGPGFGALVVVTALIAAALLAARRDD